MDDDVESKGIDIKAIYLKVVTDKKRMAWLLGTLIVVLIGLIYMAMNPVPTTVMWKTEDRNGNITYCNETYIRGELTTPICPAHVEAEKRQFNGNTEGLGLPPIPIS